MLGLSLLKQQWVNQSKLKLIKMAKTNASKEKVKMVTQLAELFDSKNTIMVVSIKGLPSQQFQKIKKQLSKEAVVKVLKKRLVNLAIEKSKKAGIKELEKYVKEDCALIISDVDPFELSGRLNKSKSPVKAKAGQEAPIDVSVEAGPTELPAGPAVSELGSLGIMVQIKAGKIEIAEPKVIVKAGDKISEGAAGIMSKLNILPFFVGFMPMAAYDSKSENVFKDVKIDIEGTIEELQYSASKALAFAVSLSYVNKETINFLLAKALINEKAIENLMSNSKEESENKNSEEKEDKKEDMKEEVEKNEDNVQENKQEETK